MKILSASILLLAASPTAHADGCLPGIYGLAHADCAGEADAFPRDDAICRAYGLSPGTRDYRICRLTKAREERLTQDETGRAFLRSPLLPDLR